MKAFVVDSDAARTITRMVHELMYQPDDCLSYADMDAVITTTNRLIHLYLTDPPEMEAFLTDLQGDHTTIKEFVEIIDELFAETLRTVNLDILELSHTVVGDESGMVLLMI